MKLNKCMYGGGGGCKRQGGDGSAQHAIGYTHPYPTVAEVGEPMGDYVAKSNLFEQVYILDDFIVDFDEDKASELLGLEISKAIDSNEILKALYDFDLSSPEGITKLLELIPVLDAVILVDLVEKIWVGYSVEAEDPELLRHEIRGWLLDSLFEGGMDDQDQDDKGQLLED